MKFARYKGTKPFYDLQINRVHVTVIRPSRRGKKILAFSRDKNEGTYRSGEGGGGPAM